MKTPEYPKCTEFESTSIIRVPIASENFVGVELNNDFVVTGSFQYRYGGTEFTQNPINCKPLEYGTLKSAQDYALALKNLDSAYYSPSLKAASVQKGAVGGSIIKNISLFIIIGSSFMILFINGIVSAIKNTFKRE